MIFLKFYIYKVLEQLKIDIYTNCYLKGVLLSFCVKGNLWDAPAESSFFQINQS